MNSVVETRTKNSQPSVVLQFETVSFLLKYNAETVVSQLTTQRILWNFKVKITGACQEVKSFANLIC